MATHIEVPFTDVQADHTLSFTTKPIAPATFTIHETHDAGCSVSPSGDVVVNAGDSVTFIADCAPGFEFDQVLVDGAPFQG